MKPRVSLLVVLLTMIIYLLRGSTQENITEENGTTPATSNVTKTKLMIETDRYICEILLEPAQEKRGIELLRMITWYTHVLAETVEEMLRLTELDKPSELSELYDRIEETDGPRFMKVIPVYDLYVSTFKWSQFSLDNLKNGLQSAKIFWEKLKQTVQDKRKLYHSNNSPV